MNYSRITGTAATYAAADPVSAAGSSFMAHWWISLQVNVQHQTLAPGGIFCPKLMSANI